MALSLSPQVVCGRFAQQCRFRRQIDEIVCARIQLPTVFFSI